jgi:hypothetical protein
MLANWSIICDSIKSMVYANVNWNLYMEIKKDYWEKWIFEQVNEWMLAHESDSIFLQLKKVWSQINIAKSLFCL